MDHGLGSHQTYDFVHNFTFDSYEVNTPCNVYLGDESIMKAIGMRTNAMKTIVRGKINQICVKDTLCVPKLRANLLSISKVVSNDLIVQFNLNKCFAKTCNGKDILYKMNFTKMYEVDATNLVQCPTEDDALEPWYHQLGHLNVKDIHRLQNMMSDMNVGKFTSSLLYEACVEGKQHKTVFMNKREDEQPSLWRLYIPTCVAP